MRRVITITGDGKGKTTSAIGCAIRAVARDYKVFFYQFIKSKDTSYGEHLFFKKSADINIVRLGLGCRKDLKYNKDDINAAVEGLKNIDRDLFKHEKAKKTNTLVILDEVSYPMIWGWIPSKDIIKLIDKYPDFSFILTGRDMPQDIIDASDTVSLIQEIKHAYQKGLKAQNGIEV